MDSIAAEQYVIFVDAGNYCRSPAAEVVARIMAENLGLSGRFRFSSAGLKDKHAGQSADPRTIAVCEQAGYDLSGFRCRRITDEDYEDADLILAMDRENLSQLKQECPTGTVCKVSLFLDEKEVPDPYFGQEDGFQIMMDQIEEGVRSLLR